MENSQETLKELSPAEKWAAEIEAAEKEFKKFHERGRRVTKKLLDERDAAHTNNKWFNIFYANTQILESALYSQLPKPTVTRRFKDYEDDVARVAALILQRSITQDLDDPRDTFDSMMKSVVQDRLVPGLGQAWLRLETDTEEIDDVLPEPTPDAETEEVSEVGVEATSEAPEPLTRITDQRVVVDYVFWEDFLVSPCRVWEERRWVARKAHMTRDQLIKRFGEDMGKLLGLDKEWMARAIKAVGTPDKQITFTSAAADPLISKLEHKTKIHLGHAVGKDLDAAQLALAQLAGDGLDVPPVRRHRGLEVARRLGHLGQQRLERAQRRRLGFLQHAAETFLVDAEAPGAAGNLVHFGLAQRAVGHAVVLGHGAEQHAPDGQVQAHADGVGGHQHLGLAAGKALGLAPAHIEAHHFARTRGRITTVCVTHAHGKMSSTPIPKAVTDKIEVAPKELLA